MQVMFAISAGKELIIWLFACLVLLYKPSYCLCYFPVWCLWQDVKFDCIGS